MHASHSGLSILHLDDSRHWRGGQQQVLYLHRGLLEQGVDSCVVCIRGSALAQRLARSDLPFRTLPLRASFDPYSAWRLAAMAHEEQALVHAHTSHGHSLALFASTLRHGFPLVVSRRVAFAVGENYASRRKYRSQRVDLYLAISAKVEAALRQGGVEAKRIRRVPSGIDLERLARVRADEVWRASLDLTEGCALVGSVSALDAKKDQVTLLRAFARMLRMGIDARLVILGEGKERARLEALRDELGLRDRVLLPGFVQDPLPRAACFDLFVLTPRQEGLGTAILDAMALGQPVVATAVGGILDVVVEGETGRLVPPADGEGLAQAMASLLRDASLARRLGKAGQRRVRELFDVRRTVALTLDAYHEILDKTPSQHPRPQTD
jgi:glycosyltransferase involved in cell wall biosynthesis